MTPALTPEQRRLRSQLANMTRHHPDSPETVKLRRELKAWRLYDHIRELIENYPPLTPQQRARLGVLLRTDDDSRGDERNCA